MKTLIHKDKMTQLDALCDRVRTLINECEYDEAKNVVASAMKDNPDAPEPHNLMGILFEQQNNHIAAMRHFRAAWALDATYLPARYNIEQYGSFSSRPHHAAYKDEDCIGDPTCEFEDRIENEPKSGSLDFMVNSLLRS